jgi:hypothetical protein
MPFSGDAIFELRQLIRDENVKEVKLVVKDKEDQREVILYKEMLLDRGNL